MKDTFPLNHLQKKRMALHSEPSSWGCYKKTTQKFKRSNFHLLLEYKIIFFYHFANINQSISHTPKRRIDAHTRQLCDLFE